MSKSHKPGVYDFYARTLAQRLSLAVFIGAAVFLAAWILLGPGLAIIGAWFGRDWQHGNSARCLALAAVLAIYYLLLLLTSFLYLKRGMRWSEALAIIPWLFGIFLLLAVFGGLNPAPFALAGWAGVALFIFGTWMHSWSEHQRHLWKQRPENRGHLYTGGLFRYTRHPNYLGDLILFSGFCLICGHWITAAIPLLMLAGFVFANIPILDKHLHEHYGNEFTHYATQTRKLIPFIY